MKFKKVWICFSVASIFFSNSLFALPTLDQVANGDVGFITADYGVVASLQVTQNSDKAIVNWQNFNISANEIVHFQQPVNGICLNRIDASSGMSQIAGNLSATAKIILINQSGILFSDTAQVNVGGIIASVADIADESFLQQRQLSFDLPSTLQGAIINRGVINVNDHGLAALLGSSVDNPGVIVAKYDTVILKSGSTFVVDFNGDGVINFASNMTLPGSAASVGKDENGNNLPNGVNASGQIINDSGDVIIMASAAPGIFDNLINMSGEIQAQNVAYTDNGVILVGDEYGRISVSGKIDVSGNAEGMFGGSIVVVGNKIVVADSVDLNVTGALQDGWIAGGNAAGKVKSFSADSDKSAYVGSFYTPSNASLIPTQTTATAIRTFNDYKKHVNFTRPVAKINVEQVQDSDRRIVNIDISYNDINLNMRSIQPEDHALVQTYLNSQPLVRGKYAHRKPIDAAATEARVKVLADRFSESVTDGCFMHGGFIITDKDTNQFLGIANSGTSGESGIAEMARLLRADAWSHKPENIAVDYKIPEGTSLQKDYKGIGTALSSALVQYNEYLIKEQYTIKGEPTIALRATNLLDNPGAWKSHAKNGFEVTAITVNKEWGQDFRYQLEYKF